VLVRPARAGPAWYATRAPKAGFGTHRASLLSSWRKFCTSGRATLEIDVRDELLQQNGYLHGGVLAYAADNALTFAGGSALGPAVLTRGFTIDYLMPARGRSDLAGSRRAHPG
jgi:hypothetical protein